MYQYNPLLEATNDSNNDGKWKQRAINAAAASTGLVVANKVPAYVARPLTRKFDFALNPGIFDKSELPKELASIKTKNGETLNKYFKTNNLGFSRTPNLVGPHFNSVTKIVNLPIKSNQRANWDKSILAHELGHNESMGKSLGKTIAYGSSKVVSSTAAIAQFINCCRSDDESRQKVGRALSIAGGTAAIPMIAEEINASIRGTRLLNLKGKDKAKAFIGIGSYIAVALSPAIIYGVSEKTRQFLRSLRQIKSENPVTNQKIANFKKQDTKVSI